MRSNEFGRRGAAQQASAPAVAPRTAKDQQDETVVDTILSSPLIGQLAGIVGGVVIIALMITLYVTTMKGMGRALSQSWERKTITPMIVEPDPAAPFGRGPCDVHSFNSEFRKLQRDLGC